MLWTYSTSSLPIRSLKMIAPSRGIVTKNWLGTPVLIRASATFPGLPLLRRSSDVVRARIAEASIACQNIASAVAVIERMILAVPIHTISACPDHRAPRSLGALRVSWIEAYRCKSSGSHQNRAPLDQSFDRRLVLVPVDYCGCQKEATPNRNTAERGADKSEAEQ
jgi:hypothetical protein